MKNYALNRKASESFIKNFRLTAGIKPGEFSRLQLLMGNGSIDYVPNADVSEETLNIALAGSRKDKQAKDAIANKKTFKAKADNARVLSNILIGAMAFIDASAVVSVFVQPIQNLLISVSGLENIVAGVAMSAVLVTAGAIAAKSVSAHREEVLEEIEDYELFFQNEKDIEKEQHNPINYIGVPKKDRRVIKKVGITSASLDRLSSYGLAVFIKNMKQTIAGKNAMSHGQKPVYNEETLGIIPEEASEEELIEESLVLERKPKKQFRFFGKGR